MISQHHVKPHTAYASHYRDVTWAPWRLKSPESPLFVTRSFDVFFGLRLNKRLSKRYEAGDLRRHRVHYDITVLLTHVNSLRVDAGLNNSCYKKGPLFSELRKGKTTTICYKRILLSRLREIFSNFIKSKWWRKWISSLLSSTQFWFIIYDTVYNFPFQIQIDVTARFCR